MQPIDFIHNAYVRIGSITRKLRDFPEKERKIWKKFNQPVFEKHIAKDNLTEQDIIELLDTQSFFELIQLPYPSSRDGVIERFKSEKLIQSTEEGLLITNLGALLFAKKLSDFPDIARKTIRVVVYDGKTRS